MAFKFDELKIFESENVTGDKILIFDDLERCKIPMDIMFGYLNNFVEHLKCKVIIICNEEELINTIEIEDDNLNNYKKIKEKLIMKNILLLLLVIINFIGMSQTFDSLQVMSRNSKSQRGGVS